jgi:hypothetical protein
VKFSPTLAGPQFAALNIAANPGGGILVNLFGTAQRPAQLSATGSLDFGVAVAGQTVDRTMTVTNTGDATAGTSAPISPSIAGAGAAFFSVANTTCGATLAGGAACDVTIRFTPTTSLGAKSATVAVSATPGNQSSTSLTGTSAAPAEISVLPPGIQFLPTTVGATSGAIPISVSNIGGVDAGTSSALQASMTGIDASQFQVTMGSCTATLAPGANCLLSVTFSPTSGGPKSATLTVTSSPGGSRTVLVAGTAQTPAQLTTQTSVAFGSVVLGNLTTANVTVTNNGDQPSGSLGTTIAGTNGSAFSVTSGTCGASLAGHSSCDLSVMFSPTLAGPNNATLSIGASPGGNLSVALAGTGLAPATLSSTSSLQFGTVAIGSSVVLTATISNSGQVTTGTLNAAITGTDAAAFGILATTCPAALAPGASCNYSVRFTAPPTGSVKTATLSVSAAPGGIINVPLSGTTATPAALTLSPRNISFPGTVLGQFVDRTTTVTNTGGSTANNLNYAISGGQASSYSVQSTTCGTSLPGGSSCTVTVRFAPLVYSGNIATQTVTADGGISASGSLIGGGSDLVWDEASFNFGLVSTSTTAAATFTLRNAGTQTLGTTTALQVSLFGGPAFSLQSTTCGATLAAGASCTATVVFHPTDFSVQSASISASATPGGASAGVSLTGQGKS